MHEKISFAYALNDCLPQINKLLDKAASHTTVQFRTNNFTLTLDTDPQDLLSPVWIVMQSLNELLLTEDIERIKECPGCGWVFVDRTKNATRRWCAPEDCGSADKMQRYNAKKNKAALLFQAQYHVNLLSFNAAYKHLLKTKRKLQQVKT